MSNEHDRSQSDCLARWSVFRSASTLSKKGRFWKVVNVYLSEVCLAAHLEPRSPGDMEEAEWKPAEAKEELGSLMRRLKYLAMDHDIYYPVVGVLARSPSKPPTSWSDGAHVSRWISDQEWHRGAFLLYLESGEAPSGSEEPLPAVQSQTRSADAVRDRLQDLLGGEPMDWPEERETKVRDCMSFCRRIEEALEKSPPEGALTGKTVRDLFGVFQAACSEKGAAQTTKEDAFKAVISGWVDELIRQAEKMAQG